MTKIGESNESLATSFRRQAGQWRPHLAKRDLPMDQLERQSLVVEVKGSSARRLLASLPEVDGVAFAWEEVFRGPLAVAAVENSDETTFLLARPTSEIPGREAWDLAHRLRLALPPDLVAEGAVLRSSRTSVRCRPTSPGPTMATKGSSGRPTPPPRPTAPPIRRTGPGRSGRAPPGISAAPSASWRKPERISSRGPGGCGSGISTPATAPDPVTRPRHLRRDLGYNFYRNSSDTTDNLGGTFQGHGTRTVSVLAGNRIEVAGFYGDLGGAPDAEVVPIVADGSIVITNFNLTLWARAFEHAVLCECDVLSVSAGGVWVDGGVVEKALRLVEARGIVVVAAAGNHFCGPQDMVWPARYDTVVAVTGVMANQTPYTSCSLRYYSSSYGPPAAMGTAIAASTPNVPAARHGCPAVVNYNADGTSHSTPRWPPPPRCGSRNTATNIRRNAGPWLAGRRSSSRPKKWPEHAWMFGNGILKAKDALDLAFAEAELESLAPEPEPQPEVLAGFGAGESLLALERTLLERELLGLARRNPRLWSELQNTEAESGKRASPGSSRKKGCRSRCGVSSPEPDAFPFVWKP